MDLSFPILFSCLRHKQKNIGQILESLRKTNRLEKLPALLQPTLTFNQSRLFLPYIMLPGFIFIYHLLSRVNR